MARDLWSDKRPLDVVATGGSTTSAVVASQAYSSQSANAYDGVYIYVLTDAGGASAAPEGEQGRVTTAGFTASSGTWTISPTLTAAIASGDTLQFLYGLDRTAIFNAVNRIVGSLYMPAYTILTLIDDGDFSATGVTNWADAVGTPTQTKDTTSGRVLIGAQSLKLVIANSGDAVTSNSVRVHEGEQLHLSVPVMCDAGSITVSLYDVTNATAIKSVTVDEEDWAEVRFTETVPADCEEVAIRIAAAEATTTAWVGWASLLYGLRGIYTLPSLAADTAYVDGMYYLPQGYTSEDADSFIALSHQLIPVQMVDELRDWRGDVSQRIVINETPRGPLFIKFRRVGPTLTADTDVVYAPADLVVEGALSELTKTLALRHDAGTPNHVNLMRRSAQHASSYAHMLDSLGLARPRPKAIRRPSRVNAGYRPY